VDVRVQVDQAGRDDTSGEVEHLRRAGTRQVRRDRRDPAAVYRHVEPPDVAATGVDHLGPGEEQVHRHVASARRPLA
jgi:hypothetical protein